MNVVIGGGSGIGAAVVELLQGETLVADRVGGKVVCDVTDRASLDALVAKVDDLDSLVVTAGLSPSLAGADAHGPAIRDRAADEATAVVRAP